MGNVMDRNDCACFVTSASCDLLANSYDYRNLYFNIRAIHPWIRAATEFPDPLADSFVWYFLA